MTKPIDTRALPNLIERYLARHPTSPRAMSNDGEDPGMEGAD